MPTYTFRCAACGSRAEIVKSITAYTQERPAFYCCGQTMERYFDTAPALGVVGETHYDGLRATDGTDISTRAKHRAYMKANNLTTVDDFRDTWKKNARERELRMQGMDTARASDLASAIDKLGG
jgi:predicted nucleic acid-binding Zn ribbon protein